MEVRFWKFSAAMVSLCLKLFMNVSLWEKRPLYNCIISNIFIYKNIYIIMGKTYDVSPYNSQNSHPSIRYWVGCVQPVCTKYYKMRGLQNVAMKYEIQDVWDGYWLIVCGWTRIVHLYQWRKFTLHGGLCLIWFVSHFNTKYSDMSW